MVVQIPSQGKELLCWLKKSDGAETIAILLPGFLDSGEYPHLKELSINLQDSGLASIRFDPPGIWKNGEDISDYNLSNYSQAVIDIFEWAKQKLNVKQCILIGHSFGGVVAIVAASRLKSTATVIAIMPPAYLKVTINWPKDEARKAIRPMPNNLDKTKEFSVPYSFVKDLDCFDIPAIVSALKSPILFIAGELDTLIPPQEVKSLFGHASQGHYRLIKNVEHGYWHHPQQIESVNEAVLKFIKEHQFAGIA